MEQTKTKRSNTTTKTSRYESPSLFPKKKQPREIKPAEIHELRLKTSKIQQQTKLMKTQLNRIKDRINTTTKAINQTVTNSREPSKAKGHETTTAQIKKSIEAAQATNQDLDAQLKEAQLDDRSALVEELQEELKIAYCEYQRLQEETKRTASDSGALQKKLAEADARTSKAHTKELDLAISQTKASNKQLKEKIIAYNKKMERNKIEKTINERKKEGMSQQYCEIEITDTKRYRTEKYNMLANELNEEMEKFDSRVDMLNKIINEQRTKIINFLMNQKDKGEEALEEEEGKREGEEEEEPYEPL